MRAAIPDGIARIVEGAMQSVLVVVISRQHDALTSSLESHISKPEDVGLHPDGALLMDQPVQTAAGASPDPRLRMRAVLRDRNFWVIAMGFALIFCCMSATLTHMVPRITDLGHPLARASLVMSLCAGMGVFGKLSFGWLGDKLSVQNNMLIIVFVQFLGQLIMYLNEDLLVFAIGAALFGYGVGGVVPMQGTTVAKTFGRERFGAVLGAIRPAQFPITILGVPFAGWVFDTTGTYDLAFQVLLAIYVAAAVAFVFYRSPVATPGSPTPHSDESGDAGANPSGT